MTSLSKCMTKCGSKLGTDKCKCAKKIWKRGPDGSSRGPIKSVYQTAVDATGKLFNPQMEMKDLHHYVELCGPEMGASIYMAEQREKGKL